MGTFVRITNVFPKITIDRRVSKGGGIWATCPYPLESNAQRKNLQKFNNL